MKAILKYISSYLKDVCWPVHLIAMALLSVLIYCNYALGINGALYRLPQPLPIVGWYALLLVVLIVPYGLYRAFRPGVIQWSSSFWAVLLLAPLVFAWKMTAPVHLYPRVTQQLFWNAVFYFTAKAAIVTGMLLLIRRWAGEDGAVMGLRSPARGMMPYFIMLLLMVPLIAAAATQPDFLRVYPKALHMLAPGDVQQGWKLLLFEAAYGIDFFTIELFFRGFLVIYFSRWAKAQAILPMAVIYCVIHFGKPLGECVSSFFGGMLLGIVSYHTRSIWGGLAVHLGIAWLMELAGWVVKYPVVP
ncbi:CPBP family intramembrane glutamic endopeptidase [Paracnuella aquatica]|uniref:CPBP family intramembrane glutamic endopeptidase n=1 Tax=Paracnuella aquatica TaxID=2268757 RepID=UPI000DEF1E24|nr:CPBP family intramembrane glutamic endopeptidase [Paracnuella aquatica]RPD51367.1 CPBP family intramembrane metalloprotease [Paracnuella aquatica]